MRRLSLFTAVAALALASPALAQSMGSMPGMQMPGMPMPAKEKSKPKASKPAHPKKAQSTTEPRAQVKPAAPTPSAHDHHDMPGMPGQADQQQQHAGHDTAMPGMAMDKAKTEDAQGGTNLPAGDAPPPSVPIDHAADRSFPSDVMAQARHEFRTEHGAENFHQVLFNLAEYQVRDGKDGYRWDGEAWWGGDINRLVVKSEGEGRFHEGVDSAEVQALYSRAISPYFNLQAGIRHDFRPSPTRTYATVGVEGLAPYMFETEAALFLSNKGDLLGRIEGWYDQRLTQRLILQPRAEINLAAQNIPELGIGAGIDRVEAGLRLRYEISRQFAPYVGVEQELRLGKSADYARAGNDRANQTNFVAGVRFFF